MMTVERILSSKGREVVTIEPDRTLAEAARLLAQRRIGAAVVSENGRDIHGMVSERDIVRAVATEGAGALDHPLSRHMTYKVTTCTCSAAINEIMGIMTNGKFRHVPVVEDGRVVGIVSIGDVVKHRIAEVEAEHHALREYIATA